MISASSSSSNVIPFPPLPGEYDLFLGPSSTTASTGIVGLAVKMAHRPCRACGSVNFIIGSSKSMHHAALRCMDCNQHSGWLSKGALTFIEMTVEKFGRPVEPVIVRHSNQSEGF
jgi:hypothetical protein